MADTYPNSVSGRPDRESLEWEKAAIDTLTNLLGDDLFEIQLDPEMPVFVINPQRIVEVAESLREVADEVRFPFLLDVTAVDYLKYSESTPERFAVIWHFLDHERGRRLRVKAYVADGKAVPSLTGLYPAANWSEREVFDMMGISFDGHPNLVRILMPLWYEGHPQRKDFPIQGPDKPKRSDGELLGNKQLTSWKELHEL